MKGMYVCSTAVDCMLFTLIRLDGFIISNTDNEIH